MRPLLAILGAAIVLFTLFDTVKTILWLQGGGLLTRPLSKWMSRLARARQPAARSHRLLSLVGVGVLLATFTSWVLLAWLGWTLLFVSGPAAVVDVESGRPADLASRIYFTGYTLITLGMGNLMPRGDMWQIATVLASINGFFLVTLAITYLLPVVSAATRKRQTALYIASLGDTPHAIVLNSRRADGRSSLAAHAPTLVSQLALIRENHIAYPILHYFHASEPSTSLPLNLARLVEALTLLERGVKDGAGGGELRPLRRVIHTYLSTLPESSGRRDVDPPPAPSLEPLRAGGIQTVSDEAFAAACSGDAVGRRALLGLVSEDGWRWTEVYGERAD